MGADCKMNPVQTARVTRFFPAKPTLFDVPVSNHGARVRFLIYSKGLESKIDIKSPMEFNGGIKSPEYLALHPCGKTPVLVLPDGQTIPESEVISQYILDAYKGFGPDFTVDTPEKRAKSNWISGLHDVYLSPVQGAMYKAMDIEDRAEKISQIKYLLDVFESNVDQPFMLGDTISGADATLFPTFTFMNFMLPKFFGWESIFVGRPKLQAWWAAISSNAEAAKVIEEIESCLDRWEKGDRWNKLGITEQIKDTSYTWSY